MCWLAGRSFPQLNISQILHLLIFGSDNMKLPLENPEPSSEHAILKGRSQSRVHSRRQDSRTASSGSITNNGGFTSEKQRTYLRLLTHNHKISRYIIFWEMLTSCTRSSVINSQEISCHTNKIERKIDSEGVTCAGKRYVCLAILVHLSTAHLLQAVS